MENATPHVSIQPPPSAPQLAAKMLVDLSWSRHYRRRRNPTVVVLTGSLLSRNLYLQTSRPTPSPALSPSFYFLPKMSPKIISLLVLLTALSSSSVADISIGINFSTLADNLPSPPHQEPSSHLPLLSDPYRSTHLLPVHLPPPEDPYFARAPVHEPVFPALPTKSPPSSSLPGSDHRYSTPCAPRSLHTRNPLQLLPLQNHCSASIAPCLQPNYRHRWLRSRPPTSNRCPQPDCLLALCLLLGLLSGEIL